MHRFFRPVMPRENKPPPRSGAWSRGGAGGWRGGCSLPLLRCIFSTTCNNLMPLVPHERRGSLSSCLPGEDLNPFPRSGTPATRSPAALRPETDESSSAAAETCGGCLLTFAASPSERSGGEGEEGLAWGRPSSLSVRNERPASPAGYEGGTVSPIYIKFHLLKHQRAPENVSRSPKAFRKWLSAKKISKDRK
nr:uncharacterized protein LOC105483228 [Macaca nemestrina]